MLVLVPARGEFRAKLADLLLQPPSVDGEAPDEAVSRGSSDQVAKDHLLRGVVHGAVLVAHEREKRFHPQIPVLLVGKGENHGLGKTNAVDEKIAVGTAENSAWARGNVRHLVKENLTALSSPRQNLNNRQGQIKIQYTHMKMKRFYSRGQGGEW